MVSEAEALCDRGAEAVTGEEFQIFLVTALHLKEDNPSYRNGQAYFNALYALHPEIADTYRGGSLDPFYSDTVLPRFLTDLHARHVK